jgi:hypothetical protein
MVHFEMGKLLGLLFLAITASSCGPTLKINANQFQNNPLLGQNPVQSQDPFGLDSRIVVTGLNLPGTLAGATPPVNLSETGIFTSTQNLQVKPGVIEFGVNTALWSNGTLKRRWIIVPGTQTIGFSPGNVYTYPVGTVFVKHFEVRLDVGIIKRLETRLLIRGQSGWEGFLFKWNAGDTDAVLMMGGAGSIPDEPYSIDLTSYNGPSSRAISYRYPVARCLDCHNSQEGPLGFNSPQLNGPYNYGAVTDNQIRTLNYIGLFGSSANSFLTSYNSNKKVFTGSVGRYPALLDTSEPLENRVRAHLAANCTACHKPGGGPSGLAAGINMDLRYNTSLAATNLIGTNNRIVPGNPTQSLLFNRVGGSGQLSTMPPAGIVGQQIGEPDFVDNPSVGLLGNWISSLPN